MTDTTIADVAAEAAPAIRDGRFRRSDRTKLAVLRGCRTLMTTGVLRPTMALVCAQADVSVRSGFQHYVALEDLYRSAIDDEETRDAILKHALGADWRDALRWHDRAEKLVAVIVLGRTET
jgi:hypothetical protein